MVKLTISEDKPIAEQLKEAFATWENIHQNGANADVWTDGMVLNLVRKKIIRLKKMLKEDVMADKYKRLLEKEVPPKSDYEYYAPNTQKKARTKTYQKDTEDKKTSHNTIDNSTKGEERGEQKENTISSTIVEEKKPRARRRTKKQETNSEETQKTKTTRTKKKKKDADGYEQLSLF